MNTFTEVPVKELTPEELALLAVKDTDSLPFTMDEETDEAPEAPALH